MLKIIKSNIPNTITCMSLVCGCVACIMSFNYNVMSGGLYGYQWAFIFIGIAALFDFCDGAAARLLHAYSNLGKELDSLSDLVSFGVAPGMLIYNNLGLFRLSLGSIYCNTYSGDGRTEARAIQYRRPSDHFFSRNAYSGQCYFLDRIYSVDSSLRLSRRHGYGCSDSGNVASDGDDTHEDVLIEIQEFRYP